MSRNDSLYMRLGVLPDATPAQIRRAYRLAAKRAHPDVGGTKEEWSAILEAYETLIDDRRRRIYDDTGTIEPGAVDNHYAALLMRLASALDEIAMKSEREGPPFDQIDWVGSLRALLNTRIQQMRQGIAPLGRRAQEWDAVAQRTTVPPGAVNVLRGLAEGKAAECRRRAGEAEAQIREHEEALALIANATCPANKMPTFPGLHALNPMLGTFGRERMW